MVYLSPHFALSELTVTEVRRLQARNRSEAREHLVTLKALAQLLEEVRTLLGDQPIHVSSGYRCPELNTVIGGSPSSQHLRGEAADITLAHMSLQEAFRRIRKSKIKVGQCILEDGDGDGVPTWIHISLGPPWRDENRSNQFLIYDGTTYKRV